MRAAGAAVVLMGCLLGVAPAAALTPYMVKQINTTGTPQGSSPQSFWSAEDFAVFTADDGVHGPALWRSDGTAAGTYRLKVPYTPYEPTVFASLDDTLFFTLADANGNGGLWVTHGTSATTRKLVAPFDFLPIGNSFATYDLWPQGLVYFEAFSPPVGAQLWRSDATPGGTFPLGAWNPEELAFAAGDLYFGAVDATGPGLWKTDGTVAGTRVVQRFPTPAGQVSVPTFPFGPAGKELIFGAATAARGFELWRTNGTAAGTQPLRDLVRGPGSPGIFDWTTLGARQLFALDIGQQRNVWATNGTTLAQLTNFDSRAVFSAQGKVFSPASLGPTTFFSADDGVHGFELWATDGTKTGTHLVSDVCPGSCSSNASGQAILDGGLLFSADDGVHGNELWTTDGTKAGTHMVADVCPGSCGSSPEVIAVLGSRALFLADDADQVTQLWRTTGTAAGTFRLTGFDDTYFSSLAGDDAAVNDVLLFQGTDAAHGSELWVSDGTRAGTHLLVDINPAVVPNGANPADLQAAGSKLYFFADDGIDGTQLWVTDGSAAGTVELSSPADGLGNGAVATVASGNNLFLVTQGQQNSSLWISDGTPGGLVQLTPDTVDVLADSQLGAPAALGSTVFFVANDGVHGPALWKSDGTTAGTVPVDGVNWSGGEAQLLTPFNGELFYFLPDPEFENDRDLWRTDGTPGGTTLVAPLNTDVDDDYQPLLQDFGGRLYFFAADTDGTFGLALWSTDGTAAGTRQAASFNLDAQDGAFGEPTRFAVAGNRLFLFTSAGLWASDGTQAGTQLVSPSIEPPSSSSYPLSTAALGQKLVFLGASGASPHASIWVSDGTAAGTVPLTDAQGNPIHTATAVVAFDGAVAFSVVSAAGTALWQSDGTPAGTSQVVASGLGGPPGSYAAPALVPAGQLLYFSDSTAATGTQLWAARP